jgi:hypothetical protein
LQSTCIIDRDTDLHLHRTTTGTASNLPRLGD